MQLWGKKRGEKEKMTDNIIKALRFLTVNFPKIEKPVDELDKMCNCINLYCSNAIEHINQQQAEIERLKQSRNRWKQIAEDFDRISREEECGGKK